MGKSKFDKTCTVCQGSYKYCSGCSDYAKYPRWMESFCSDNCRKIFNTVMEYKAGIKTAHQAADALKACDLSDLKNFENSIVNLINIILESGSPVNKSIEEKQLEGKTITEETTTVETQAIEVETESEKTDDKKSNEMKQKFDSKNKFNGYKKANSNNYKK